VWTSLESPIDLLNSHALLATLQSTVEAFLVAGHHCLFWENATEAFAVEEFLRLLDRMAQNLTNSRITQVAH
jgi:hypothetical protein